MLHNEVKIQWLSDENNGDKLDVSYKNGGIESAGALQNFRTDDWSDWFDLKRFKC